MKQSTENNINPVTGTSTRLVTEYEYTDTAYKEMGKPSRIIVTGGNVQRITDYEYDANDLVTTKANMVRMADGSHTESGLITKYEYTNYDNTESTYSIRKILFGIKNPDNEDTGNIAYDGLTGGIAYEYLYDKGTGLLTNEWDPERNETVYDYDALNRLKETRFVDAWEDGVDIVKSINFNDSENRSEYTDERGNSTTFIYDTLGRLTQVIPPLETGQTARDAATTYVYDDWGRIIEVLKPAPYNPEYTGPGVITTQYVYDSFDRVRQVIYPDKKFVTLEYNDRTNTVSIYDENQELVAEETSDWAGRLIQAIQHNKFETEEEETCEWLFTYDSNNNRIRQVDPRGYTTTQTFDAFGQLTDTTLPHAEVIRPGETTPVNLNPEQSAMYDEWGNKIHDVSANENITRVPGSEYNIEYIHDVLGREIQSITRTTNPDGTAVETTTKTYYDTRGNKVEFVDGNANSWTYTYNNRNLLVAETDPEGRTVAYTYDVKGNKLSVTDPRGTATGTEGDFTTYYEYDKQNRLVKTILPDNSPSNIEDNPYTQVTYDNTGNTIEETSADGTTTRYTYTLRNQVKTKSLVAKDSPYNARELISYTYDTKGNLKKATDNKFNETRYDYDRLGRLRRTTYADNSTEEYTYDKTGNQTAITDGRGNTTRTNYNGAGWITKITDPLLHKTEYKFDPNGNQVQLIKPNGLIYKFAYDELNRLVQSIDSINQEESIFYDNNSNMIKKEDVRGTIWDYKYSASNMLEYIYANKTDDVTYDYFAHYTYDDAGNMLCVEDPENIINYVPNELNQITRIDKTFDDATYTKTYEYTPGGLLKNMTYPESTTPITYNYDNY